jgi:hypothetical protein
LNMFFKLILVNLKKRLDVTTLKSLNVKYKRILQLSMEYSLYSGNLALTRYAATWFSRSPPRFRISEGIH